jgi:hypothetical protein
MNKLIALAALTALAGSAFAQLSPVPGSSTLDGVTVTNINPLNDNATYWSNPGGLLAYKFASDDNLNTPKPGTPDNMLGLNWGSSMSANLSSIWNSINNDGGSVRIIFLGESAGWLNDFGYTYNGNPQDLTKSYSLWNDIQSLPPSNIAFGQTATISLNKGQAAGFDLWLNGSNSFGTTNSTPGAPGGYYTTFDPTRGQAGGNVNVYWSQDFISVRSYVDGTLANDIWNATYLVGYEDIRGGGDQDFNDFMVALQFFRADGTPFTPVPEPSTYGLIGAVALVGLIARRRFSKK